MSIKQSLNSCSLLELRELMHKLGHPDFEWTADQVLKLQYDEEIAVWKSGSEWCALHPKGQNEGYYNPKYGAIDALSYNIAGHSQTVAIVKAYLLYRLKV